MLQGKGTLNERGGILVLALLFLFILTALGLAIILNSQIDQAVSKNYSKTVKATFAAQTGIERMKPYLLYDLQRDPSGWQNNILWVPDGTTGAFEGGTSDCPGVPPTSDCFNLPAASLTPYVVPDDLADAHIDSVWAPDNAAGWGTYGYQLMLRNITGAGGFDRNKICVLAGGYTDTTIGPLGTPSRGSDLIEQCLIGEDISRWNNIIFIEGGETSGMGNFKIHGNVHILGPPRPPAVSDINVEVKGNQGWYNDYTSGTSITTTLAAVLNPGEAARTTLEAKIRDRNGLIDAQNGSVEFGTTSTPFDAVFGC
ncbi:MAG TPA: pilus assembly PilX N-terminal domain-containing protein, partial [Acidobacteriota bacterium]|nr:pilus assembly PilX N-terminal domain-containing protein [Acidobacteriota bacterium]